MYIYGQYNTYNQLLVISAFGEWFFSILHIPHYRTPRFRNLACLILKFLHLIETAYLPRYFLTLFDVQFVNGIISTYGLNFFIANTTAKHYFSVTLNFFWQEFNFWENNAIGCSSFWSFNCFDHSTVTLYITTFRQIGMT